MSSSTLQAGKKKKRSRKRKRPTGSEGEGRFEFFPTPGVKKSKSTHTTASASTTATASTTASTKLKEKLYRKMASKIDGARFRWINEQLYTVTGDKAKEMFDSDPNLFHIYHKGFATQMSKWPANPLDRVIFYVRTLPSSLVIADFGCGEAKLAQSVPHTVHSFDLVAANDHVTACDMANVPLPDSCVDVCVFCLSLMGTNMSDFIKEARRVLKPDGELRICEIASRFVSENEFQRDIQKFGFKLISKKLFSKLFLEFEFKAVARRKDGGKLPNIELKPCIYKRR